MSEPADKPKKRKRRWLRFSLRTFLLGVAVFAVWLGLLVHRVNKQKEAIAWVRENGGIVYYDYQLSREEPFWEVGVGMHGEITWYRGPQINDEADIPGPTWLRERIGIDYFADPVYVNLSNCDVEDLAPLSALPKVQHLEIEGWRGKTIAPIAQLTKLRSVNLQNGNVRDIEPLCAIPTLEEIYLGNANVDNVSPLQKLTDVNVYIDTRQQSTFPGEMKIKVVYPPDF